MNMSSQFTKDCLYFKTRNRKVVLRSGQNVQNSSMAELPYGRAEDHDFKKSKRFELKSKNKGKYFLEFPFEKTKVVLLS